MLPGRRALVTGASSGIGAAFARQLAERRVDLLLTGRDAIALGEQAMALQKEFGVHCEVMSADLAEPSELDALCRRVAFGDDIEVLINNAGAGWYGRFDDEDPAELSNLLHLDVVALTALCRAAIGPMAANGGGAILNVASIAAFAPGPFGAVYHAAKAYVASFTEALHEELRGSGIQVTALCPGFTSTNFHARAGARSSAVPRVAWSEPDAVAAAGLAALGRNRALCIPGRLNRSLVAAARHSPRALVRRSSGLVIERIVRSPLPGRTSQRA